MSDKRWITVLEGSWIDDGWGSIVKLEDLDQDALIRCRLCDLTENGVPLGSCSAHVVKRSGGSQGVWCWSCQCTFWEYHETPRLVPSWPPAERHCLDGNPPTYLGGCVLDATLPEHRRHGRPRCTDMIPVDVLFESRVTWNPIVLTTLCNEHVLHISAQKGPSALSCLDSIDVLLDQYGL